MKNQKLIAFIILLLIASSSAGPLAVGICQAGCSAVVVACYAAGGYTFGTITAGVGTPAVVLACNTAYGTCVSACFSAMFLPTP